MAEKTNVDLIYIQTVSITLRKDDKSESFQIDKC